MLSVVAVGGVWEGLSNLLRDPVGEEEEKRRRGNGRGLYRLGILSVSLRHWLI